MILDKNAELVVVRHARSKLQQQALLQIASAYAWRIQPLNGSQRVLGNLHLLRAPGLQIAIYIGADGRKQFLERQFQVAVSVEAGDDAIGHTTNRVIQLEPA